MTLPHVPYAGDVTAQMSFLDDTFNALGNFVVIPCTATGTNAISLTPNTNTPIITTLSNYMVFSFVATNTTTGAVTISVSGLGALKVFLPDGVTQASTATIVAARTYLVVYNSALDTGTGGFTIIAPAVPGSLPAQVFALTNASYANQGTVNTYLQGNATGNLAFTAVSLASGVTGFLQATNFNSGVGASASTVWGGDMGWHPKPYGIALYFPGNMTAGTQRLLRHTAGIPFTLPQNLTSSASTSDTAALSAAVLTIKKAVAATPNTFSNIGTITYASGAATGSFSFGSATSFVYGDVLAVDGPVSQDSTLAGVSITIFGAQNI